MCSGKKKADQLFHVRSGQPFYWIHGNASRPDFFVSSHLFVCLQEMLPWTVDAKFASRKHRKQEQTVGNTHEIHLQMVDVSWICLCHHIVFFQTWWCQVTFGKCSKAFGCGVSWCLTLKGEVQWLTIWCFLRELRSWALHSLKLTVRTWKWWFPIGISFARGLFSGAMLVSGSVSKIPFLIGSQEATHRFLSAS